MLLHCVQPAQFWTGQLQAGRAAAARWHAGGIRPLYLAAFPAQAVLEWLKGMFSSGASAEELASVQLLVVTLSLDLDVDGLPAIAPESLPDGWERVPKERSLVTQRLGNEWLASRRSLALRVPSAALPSGMGWNVLLNPAHPEYPALLSPGRLAVTPFSLDYYLGISAAIDR